MPESTSRELHAADPSRLALPDVLLVVEAGTYTAKKNCPACSAHLITEAASEAGALETMNTELRSHYGEERRRPTIGDLKRDGAIVSGYYESAGYYANLKVRYGGEVYSVSVVSDGDEETTSGDDGTDDVDWTDQDDAFGTGSAAEWILNEAMRRDAAFCREAASEELLDAVLAFIARPNDRDEVLGMAVAAAKRACGEDYQRRCDLAKNTPSTASARERTPSTP